MRIETIQTKRRLLGILQQLPFNHVLYDAVLLYKMYTQNEAVSSTKGIVTGHFASSAQLLIGPSLDGKSPIGLA